MKMIEAVVAPERLGDVKEALSRVEVFRLTVADVTGLERGEGILLRPASSIHMWFMRFAIDAVFLDRESRVLRVAEHLKPWRLAGCRGANAVVELPAGECERVGLAPGDVLVVRPA